MAGPENAKRYQTGIFLAGSASAEFFADIGLCPFEAVKVRAQRHGLGRPCCGCVQEHRRACVVGQRGGEALVRASPNAGPGVRSRRCGCRRCPATRRASATASRRSSGKRASPGAGRPPKNNVSLRDAPARAPRSLASGRLVHRHEARALARRGWGGARRLFKGITPLWGRQIPYTMMKFGAPPTTACSTGAAAGRALRGSGRAPGGQRKRLSAALPLVTDAVPVHGARWLAATPRPRGPAACPRPGPRPRACRRYARRAAPDAAAPHPLAKMAKQFLL